MDGCAYMCHRGSPWHEPCDQKHCAQTAFLTRTMTIANCDCVDYSYSQIIEKVRRALPVYCSQQFHRFVINFVSFRVLLQWVCIVSRYRVTNTHDCTQHCKTTLAYIPGNDLTLQHASASCICIAFQLVCIFCAILQLLHLVLAGFSRYFLSIFFLFGGKFEGFQSVTMMQEEF